MTERKTESKNEAIIALIARIEEYQKQLGLNDSQFAHRHRAYVGSSDTWTRRLKTRALNEVNVARWEPKLRALVARIDGQIHMLEIYAQMPMTAFAQLRYAQLQGATSDRRCVPLIGDYGVGKSWSLRYLQRSNPGETCFVEFGETSRESKGAITRKIGRALGLGDDTNPDRAFDAILEALRAQPRTLLIDEGHHGGLMLLKLIKTLINGSMAKVILGTYPTAWNRLTTQSSDAVAESRQFLGRCIKPVEMRWTLGSPDSDLSCYLQASCGFGKTDAMGLAQKVGNGIRANGNLRLLADAVERAQAEADENDIEVTPAHVATCIEALVPSFEKTTKS